MISKILISSDFEAVKSDLEDKHKHMVKFFISDEFLLENANAMICEAYIAEAEPKLLVAMAKSYRNEAQNRLLKIIEEPPKNIYFMLVAPSINMLLPTIRSRLITENKAQKKQRLSSGLNIKQLDLKDVYEYLQSIEAKDRGELGKNELKELVIAIISEALEAGIKFNQDELSYFYNQVVLADLNTKAVNLLVPIFLTILKKSRV
ncbi:DNA polymerase III subunit delta' [Campylobacter majalis]|uniref:DNA polymerase III subunit delta' n=1 Tax=Campylobacter majalis TaxID=2790656 RepID=UPI003D693B31